MKVYVDANPNEVACVPETGIPYHEILIDKTVNEAEYLAIITALKYFPKATEILSDSEVAIRQINSRLGKSDIVYACKANNLKPLLNKVLKLSKNKVKFTWIPRKENKAGKLLG